MAVSSSDAFLLPWATCLSSARRVAAFAGVVTITLIGTISLSRPAQARGLSPQDPLHYEVGSGPASFSIDRSNELWIRVGFSPSSSVSHLELQTQGDLDTYIEVFPDLEATRNDAPIAEDDDTGSFLNASVTVPLGFASPYLIRLESEQSGRFEFFGELVFVESSRCDWPAGCPLVVAASGQADAAEVLHVLRTVRSKVLLSTARGRELNELYWELALDLLPVLIFDGNLRKAVYGAVRELLPLAEATVEIAAGERVYKDFTTEELARLEWLIGTIKPHLSSGVQQRFLDLWRDYDLASQVARPLPRVLRDVELLADAPAPHTVIAKLSQEPPTKTVSGRKVPVLAESLEDLLIAARASDLRYVHRKNPSRQIAGLTRTVAFEVPSTSLAREVLVRLKEQPTIEWAELSATVHILAPTGRDPYRQDLWGLSAVRAPAAWRNTAGDCSTRVAVIDTGLKRGVADLEGRVLQDLGYDFAEDDPDPEDGHGHGTHVAGTIASTRGNATSIVGVAPQVCVFGVKVLEDDGEGTSEAVAAGIVHAADSGASVINMSLGCDCEVQRVIEDALEYAAHRDVVVVAAAGNDAVGRLHYPASSSYTLAVTALDRDLTLADFSSYGPGTTLAAPGVDVVSLFRDGESCMGSGTSMAAPHVAGVAALVRARAPSLSRQDVSAVLSDTAFDLGSSGYDTSYGHGLVDAAAAVAAVAGTDVPDESCKQSETALCLEAGRFKVETFWRSPDGVAGKGRAVALTPNTGYFWFFGSANVEVVAKVLNACNTPSSRFWVFAGGLTNVEVTLRVTDKVTGVVRDYLNPPGTPFQPIQDTSAFDTCAAKGLDHAGSSSTEPIGYSPFESVTLSRDSLTFAEASAAAGANCTGSQTALCLAGNRFRVEAFWRRPDGVRGQGQAVKLTSNTGYFWFFSSSNVEVISKVLDTCGTTGGRYWVFAGGLTNVEVTMRVTDTVTGLVKEYINQQGRAFPPIQDTQGFDTCS